MADPTTVSTYPLDNVQTVFDVNFDYLAQAFVRVTLIGETQQVLVLGTDYTFTTPTTIQTTVAYGPPDFPFIEVRRVTSATERLVEFNDASILHASDLNTSDLQVIHIAEEARDAATETLGVNNDGNLDARGRRIVNLADPVDLGDAVNIRWYQEQVDETHADKLAAEAAKVAAQAAQAASESARDISVSAAASTAGSVAAASASASSASASAAASAASSTSALQYRNEAEGFKNTAGASASAAALSESAAASSAAAAAASAASINDSNLVHKTGDETIGGIKTFTSSPVLPGDATSSLQAVPKQQLDSSVSSLQSADAALDARLDLLEYVSVSGTLTGANTSVAVPSWATRIEISLHNVGTTAVSKPFIRLLSALGNAGTISGGVTNIGVSTVGSSLMTGTSFFLAHSWDASVVAAGNITIQRLTSTVWVGDSRLGRTDVGGTFLAGGAFTLDNSGPPQSLNFSANAGNFDANSFYSIKFRP